MPNMSALEKFVAAQTAALQPQFTNVMSLQWLVSTTGKKEHQEALVNATKQMRLYLADSARLSEATNLLQQADPNAKSRHDRQLLRQIKLLRDEFAGHRADAALLNQVSDLEAEVQQAFVNFRATVEGKPMLDNDIKEILSKSNDAEIRQEAWEASKQIGQQVSGNIRQLAHLRNKIAQQAGFANYYLMRLELDELSEQEVFGLFDQLAELTEPAWQQYKRDLDAGLAKRFGVRVQDLRPWHYGDPFFQEAQPSNIDMDRLFIDKDLVALTRRYFNAIGFEVDDILARSDLFEREGKEQHAFCAHVDRSGDIRILSNNRPNVYWMGTMLHEMGHAVYDKYLDMSLPYLLRGPAHTLTTEAIALMSDDMVQLGAWLSRYAGISQEEGKLLERGLAQEQRQASLLFARWVFVMSNFERELYRNPDQDLNALWWGLVERYQGLHRPDQLTGHEWASKIHIACFPAYYHNYLLGAMIAAQLYEHLLNEVAGGDVDVLVSDPKVGQFMIERLFQPGAQQDWRGWLFDATGKQLSAEAYARTIGG